MSKLECELKQQRHKSNILWFHNTEYPVSGICVLSQLSGIGADALTTGRLQRQRVRMTLNTQGLGVIRLKT